jgi:general secretion pathway protein M
LPTGRRGQALAVGLLLLLLGCLYLVAVAPLVSLYQQRATALEDGRVLLPHLEAVAAELPSLRARLNELKSAARTRKVTLDGASDALASASLQSRIEALAASVGATIGSTESLPVEAAQGYRRIGLRFVLSGPYETLVRLLARVQQATPPLVVDNVQFHGMLRRPIMPQGTAAPSGLDGEIDVYGFRSDDRTASAGP